MMPQVQSYAAPTVAAQEDMPLIVVVLQGLAGAAEELEVLELSVQAHKPPRLMLAAMAATQQSRVRRGLAELTVIRWEAGAARVEEPVTHHKVMAMAGVLNTVEAVEEAVGVPLILTTPTTRSRVALACTEQAGEAAAGLEQAVLVRI